MRSYALGWILTRSDVFCDKTNSWAPVLTRSITLLPVAISALLVFGVAHMFWLILAMSMLIYVLFPDSWLNDGISKSYYLAHLFVPILSLPLAIFIENLRPKRTVVYCLSALAPAAVFYGYGLLQQVFSQQESSSKEYLYFLLLAAPIFLGLPIAIFLLRQERRRKAPCSSLD